MISEVSVRKDMRFLEQKGLLKRVHGGAVLAEDAAGLLDLSERYLLNRTAKENIARKAAEMLNRSGLCIFIDTGTTNLLLARAIPRDLNITIVTNSFSTITALEGRGNCNVITLGGTVNYRNKTFEGPWADSLLERFNFDFLFVGADSVSADGFGYAGDLAQIELLRKAISRARSFYVLADSSKVENRLGGVYAKAADVTAWITDDKVSQSFTKTFKEIGGKIIVAD